MKNWRKRLLPLAAAALAAALAGCSQPPLAPDTVLMTIDGREVAVQEYRFDYLNMKKQFDSGDDAYWKDNADQKETLKNQTLAQIQNRDAMNAIFDDAGVALTAEDEALLQSRYDEMEQQYGGAESFQQALTDNFYTDGLYRDVLALPMRQSRYLYHTQKEKIYQNFVRAKHILVMFSKTADDEEEDRAEKKALAQQLCDRARAGEDFDALIEEYGEDPGMKSYPEGYYFSTGEMVESFEKAAFALGENEISDPVESSRGYHVILRLPMEESYLIAHLEELISERDEYFTDYQTLLEEKTAAQKVEFTDAYKRVDVSTIE